MRILSDESWEMVVLLITDALNQAESEARVLEQHHELLVRTFGEQLKQDCAVIWKYLEEKNWDKVAPEFLIMLATVRAAMSEVGAEQNAGLVRLYTSVLVADGWARYIKREVTP